MMGTRFHIGVNSESVGYKGGERRERKGIPRAEEIKNDGEECCETPDPYSRSGFCARDQSFDCDEDRCGRCFAIDSTEKYTSPRATQCRSRFVVG